MSSHLRTVLVTLSCVGLSACASTPPQQLLVARDAYSRAGQSSARINAPADLKAAEVALDRAERSFREDGASADTVDLAYIAERRAQLATAVGDRTIAEADAARYGKQRAAVSDGMRRDAVDELRTTKQELGRTEVQVTREQAARAEAERGTARANVEADKARFDTAVAEAKVTEMRAALERWGQLVENERGLVITLSSGVLFTTGQSNVLPAATDRLTQVAAFMRASPERRVTVEGYTDSAGDDASNRVLSQARADAVRSYLVMQGVAAESISAIGFGEARPVSTNATVSGRATNRRVEIVLAPLPIPQR